MPYDYGDSFTKLGAQRLADEITGYWAQRGYIVHTDVFDIGSVRPDEGRRMGRCYVVRSDMFNGLPRAAELVPKVAA